MVKTSKNMTLSEFPENFVRITEFCIYQYLTSSMLFKETKRNFAAFIVIV